MAMASLPPTCITPVRHSQHVAIVLEPYICYKPAVVEATCICKPVEHAGSYNFFKLTSAWCTTQLSSTMSLLQLEMPVALTSEKSGTEVAMISILLTVHAVHYNHSHRPHPPYCVCITHE